MNSQLKLPIASPPWTTLGRKLESMCRKAIFDYHLLDDTEQIAIALSGGKDSLTLLFLLKAIIGHGLPNLPIHAIHITGEFSCGASVNSSYLKSICDALGINYISCPSTQKKETLSCYRCSRERRTLIFEAAKKVGAKTIAFGHHQDDSIQTLLLNLLHKGEFAGNLPNVFMHDYGVRIIRPLIYISENEIREFAKIYGFARITCQCPVGQTSKRQETKELLKQIEEIFPHASINLAHASLKYGSKKALDK